MIGEIGCRLLVRIKTLIFSPMRANSSVQQSRDWAFWSGFSRCSISSKGLIFGDGERNDGELKESGECRPVSCWKKASCVAILLAVCGGGGPAEGDHGC